MFVKTTTLLALAAASAALAQNAVTVDETPVGSYVFPPSRGKSSLISTESPCQGFELGRRVPYPLTGGKVALSATKDWHEFSFRYSTVQDVQSQDDFQDGVNYPEGVTGGLTCVDGPDFAGLGLSANQNITMQFTYTAGPQRTRQYECADLTLVSASDFTALNIDEQCYNRWTSTQAKRTSASNPKLYELQQAAYAAASESAAAASSASSSSSGLSVTEAGVVGAMVTLGTVSLVLIISFIAGLIGPGNKTKAGRKSQQTHEHDVKSLSSA